MNQTTCQSVRHNAKICRFDFQIFNKAKNCIIVSYHLAASANRSDAAIAILVQYTSYYQDHGASHAPFLIMRWSHVLQHVPSIVPTHRTMHQASYQHTVPCTKHRTNTPYHAPSIVPTCPVPCTKHRTTTLHHAPYHVPHHVLNQCTTKSSYMIPYIVSIYFELR